MKLVQFIQDSNGELSSKRLVAFTSFGFFVGAGCVNTFTHFVTPEIYATALRDITIGGLLLSVPEMFATAKQQSRSTTTMSETTTIAAPPSEKR